MQYFVVLTLAAPTGSGFGQSTIARTVTVRPGSTRAELYTWALRQCPPEFANANVLFFCAEPNELGA